jgi:Helix-turn-helix domain
MSISTVAQVRSLSKSQGSARTLLLVIASHVNSDTGWAWPSLARLADEIARTRRHVIRLITQLETLGELEVRHGHGRGHVNFYRVHLTLADRGPVAPVEKVTSTSGKGDMPRQEKVTWAPEKGDISNREKVTSMSPKSKREREKKGAPLAPVALSLDKPEMHNPFWCNAHGFCHGGRLPDHRPDCAREGDPRC